MFLPRNAKKSPYSIVAYLVILLVLGVLLPVSLPLGPELIGKAPNAAYSLKTTTEDMSHFAREIMRVYHSDEPTALKEMFHPQVKIDERNSWGAGMAIESVGDRTTYWHSGINPGMQSLFIVEPDSDSAAIIMTNSDSGLDFSKEITRQALGINGAWNIIRTEY